MAGQAFTKEAWLNQSREEHVEIAAAEEEDHAKRAKKSKKSALSAQRFLKMKSQRCNFPLFYSVCIDNIYIF